MPHPAHEPAPELEPQHPAVMIGGPLDGQQRLLHGALHGPVRPGRDEPPLVWIHTEGVDVGRLVDVAARRMERRQYRYRRAGRDDARMWRYEFAGSI